VGVSLGLDKSRRILLIRFTGVVTDDVLLSGFQSVREWIAIHGDTSSITDFSEIESFEVTAAAVRQLAEGPPLVPDGYMRIVVAPQDEAFGMARMFEMLGSESRDRVYVVRTHIEAAQIVGVEQLEFPPALEQ
jgi:hypothetical protein